MADPKGFLKYNRELPPRRSVEERKRDWIEVYVDFPDEKLQRQAARCMDCGIPFCHQGCPLGNIIPDWNDLTYRGRWREALAELHATNNFPEFTGKLCPAPCEASCVLGINQDPVTIRRIEESLAMRGWSEGWIEPEPPERRTGLKVAVVGSGPAGLAAAQQLNRAGHSVTVFERDDRPGGLLRYGIPDFKMEKWVLDRRLKQMEAEGVEFRCGVNVGVDISGEQLQAEFGAIVLAGGSTVPRDLPVPGRELDGIHFAMDFLPQQNRKVAGLSAVSSNSEFAPPYGTNVLPPNSGGRSGASLPMEPASDLSSSEAGHERLQITAEGKRVVIIGGGDTGADCLGTVHRQGAIAVTQFEIMPKPPSDRDETMPWPLYPMVLRTSAAHEEGGERDWSVSTTAFSGENGTVKKLHGVRVGWSQPDEHGRRKMEEIRGSEFEIEADLVLLAMGFLHPQKEGLIEQLGVDLDARGNVKTDHTYATSVPGIYACGDMRRGQSLIVWAIAEGREAARGADTYLSGSSLLPLTRAT